jgi:putative protein-disulfide isomerase
VHGRSKQAWGHINFLRDLDSEAMRQRTRDDFAQAQRWGVRGFPTLLAVVDGQAQLLTSGFIDAATLAQRLAPLLDI